MAALLKRKYKLTIGTPRVETIISKVVTEQEVFGNLLIPTEQDYRTIKGGAVAITDLDITATISAKSSNGGNSGTVLNIYNLSPETLQTVEQNNNYIILEAGFSSDKELRIIFTGTVSNVYTSRQGRDLVTSLTCADGYIPNNSVRLSKTFPEYTTANKVFEYLIQQYKAVGVPLGQYVSQVDPKEKVAYVQLSSPNVTSFYTGYSLNGWLGDELKDLCKQIGYVGYITNGRLFIHPKSYTKTTERFLYAENQLFSVRKSTQNTSSATSKPDTGITVRMQLDGRLGVDKQIQITTGNFKGIYKIQSCSFELGYRDGGWDTILVCKQIEA